jgi:hypothetical protein
MMPAGWKYRGVEHPPMRNEGSSPASLTFENAHSTLNLNLKLKLNLNLYPSLYG